MLLMIHTNNLCTQHGQDMHNQSPPLPIKIGTSHDGSTDVFFYDMLLPLRVIPVIEEGPPVPLSQALHKVHLINPAQLKPEPKQNLKLPLSSTFKALSYAKPTLNEAGIDSSFKAARG